MNLDSATLLQLVAALAGLVAAAGAVATAAVGLSRSARLRAEEMLWRQVLETSATADHARQRQLLHDLHQYALARLISQRLVPSRPVSTVIIVSCLLASAALFGVLAVAIYLEGPTSIPGLWLWVTAATFGVSMQAGWSTTVHVVDEAGARQGVMRRVLDASYPLPTHVPAGRARITAYSGRSRTGWMLTAGALGATLTIAGLSAVILIGFSPVLFSAGTLEAADSWLFAAAALVTGIGGALAAVCWHNLVPATGLRSEMLGSVQPTSSSGIEPAARARSLRPAVWVAMGFAAGAAWGAAAQEAARW